MIIVREAGGRFRGIAHAVELQLLDHETRDDLFISVHLEGRLLGEELRLALAEEEREQSNALVGGAPHKGTAPSPNTRRRFERSGKMVTKHPRLLRLESTN